MMNDDMVASYFVRISQIKDQIVVTGETILENELATTTLNGLPRSQDAFTVGLISRKAMPTFEEM